MSTPAAAAVTFYWHDYETFGVDPTRDAPSQFAGVRTNEALEEIGEPLMLFCRPPRDALPHPKACLVTGLTPQVCEARGLPEAEFARHIHAELSTEGTIGVGYNSLRFDDQVSRHLFWRNLLDVYGREFQNRCSRWDLFHVVRAVYAFRPDALVWPTAPDGRHSLKLEQLTAANGLAHDSAHDALSDVRATIALARLIRERVRPLWDHCLGLRSKQRVQELIGPVHGRRQAFLHVSGMIPQAQGHVAVVWPLATRPGRSNEVIVWDLAHDPMELIGLDAATIRQRLFTRPDDLPEGQHRLPIKLIKVNESPIVAPLPRLRPQRAAQLGLDLAACQQRAERAAASAAAFDAVPWAEVYTPPEPQSGLDAEQQLYGGFLGRQDQQTLARLPVRDPDALARCQPAFDDPRLEDLFLRYRARNWPDSLSQDEQAVWEAHRHARLHEGKGGYLSLQRYHDLIDEAAESADERAQAILEDLLDWAESLAG